MGSDEAFLGLATPHGCCTCPLCVPDKPYFVDAPLSTPVVYETVTPAVWRVFDSLEVPALSVSPPIDWASAELAASKAECETLRTKVAELEAQLARVREAVR